MQFDYGEFVFRDITTFGKNLYLLRVGALTSLSLVPLYTKDIDLQLSFNGSPTIYGNNRVKTSM